MRLPLPQQLLGWLGASAGASGILIALGYLVDLGIGRALGIELGDKRTSDLAQVAVDWLLHTIALTWDHWYAGVVTLLILAILLEVARNRGGADFIVRHRLRVVTNLPQAAIGYLLVVIAVPAWQIASYDLVALQVRDLLVQPKPSFLAEGGIFASKRTELWTNLRCSRVSGSATPPQTEVVGAVSKRDQVLKKAAAERDGPSCADKNPEHYKSALERRYVLAFWVALIFTGLGVHAVIVRASSRTTRFGPVRRSSSAVLAAFAFALAFTHLLMVPHVYGRTIKPPEFPHVIVILHPDKVSGVSPISLTGVLLANTDRDLLMYVYGENVPVWSIPRAGVARVVYNAKVDILWCHFVQQGSCQPSRRD
jgi:hypothetical protein